MITNQSIWEIELPTHSSLNQNIGCDVLIIGGGLAGVLTAYYLKQAKLDVVLVEKNKIGQGITNKTTAVLSAQHDVLYTDLINEIGLEHAKLYLEANLKAIHQYKELSKAYEFDYKQEPSIMYTVDNKDKLEEELNQLKRLGYEDCEFVNDIPLDFPYKAALQYNNMASMHPLKLIKELCKNLVIYENTCVVNVKGNMAYTDQYTIEANHIVMATHYPILDRFGCYYMKQYQTRSYVIVYENGPVLNSTLLNYDKGFYVRNYNQYFIIGTGDHRTGKGKCAFNEIREYMNKVYPNAKEVMHFANQDCTTLDKVAYIGRYSYFTPHLQVITGMNLWGMTTSMIAAHIIKDEILQNSNPYKKVFIPQRNMFHKQIFLNMIETCLQMLKPTTKRCSHLGCGLTYNADEKSWDCSCHGSRFDETGQVLDNPANKDGYI